MRYAVIVLLIVGYTGLLLALILVSRPLADRAWKPTTWIWLVVYFVAPPVGWFRSHYVYAREAKGMCPSRSRVFALLHTLFFLFICPQYITGFLFGASAFKLVPLIALLWFVQPVALIVQSVRSYGKA